jgi:hypothetical protein
VFSSSATAAQSAWFCPNQPFGGPNGGWVIGGLQRCTGNTPFMLNRVIYTTTNGPGVYHCAGAKSGPSGEGAHILPQHCSTNAVVTGWYTCGHACVGYPTGWNESTSPHRFYGELRHGDAS